MEENKNNVSSNGSKDSGNKAGFKADKNNELQEQILTSLDDDPMTIEEPKEAATSLETS